MGIVLVVCDSHRRKAAIASHLLDAAVSTHLSHSHPVLAELKVAVSQKNIIPIVDKSVSKNGRLYSPKYKPTELDIPIVIDAWGTGEITVPPKVDSPFGISCLPCIVAICDAYLSPMNSIADFENFFGQAVQKCNSDCSGSDELESKVTCSDNLEMADICTKFISYLGGFKI